MFQKNLNALKQTNAKLAEKLAKITIDEAKKDIEVFEAESKDVIIAYKKNPLDSIYDPIREAKTIWHKTIREELKKNDIQIVFGLGLGYLFKRAYAGAESRIVVFEPITEVIRFVLEYVDLSAELSDKRVYITDNMQDCIDYITQKYLTEDRIEVLYSKYYANIAQAELMKFSEELLELCKQKNLDVNTIKNLKNVWISNTIKNIKHYTNARPIDILKNKFAGKTALIAAAGPSLNNDLALLKANRDKFTVFCVNRAVSILIKNGIIPDFVVFADAFADNTLDGVKDQLANTNFILNPRTDQLAFETESKSKLIYFFNSDNFTLTLKEKYNANISTYESAGTVAINAYFAAKTMGFSQIIFSGLDLAFTGGFIYADNTKAQLDKAGELTGNIKNKKVLYVKDKNGNDIPTRDDLCLFIRQFEEILEKTPDNELYNTSSGAYIKGMKYETLDSILKLKKADLTRAKVDEIVKSAYEHSQSEWKCTNKTIIKMLTEEKAHLENIYSELKPAIQELNYICEYIESNNSITEIEDSIKSALDSTAQLIQMFTNNTFLMQFMQISLLQYTRTSVTSMFSSIEELKKSKQNDLQLLNQAKEGIEFIIRELNGVLEENAVLL